MTTAAAVFLLLIALLGVAAHHVDSRRQVVLVGGALAHVLMLAAVPGALLAAVAAGPPGAAAGGVVLLGCAWTQLPLWRNRFRRTQAELPGDSTELTVLHANIWLGRADLDALSALVHEHRPDVLTVVEVNPEADAGLRERVSDLLPYSFVRPARGGRGSGIYSRHPLLDPQRYDGFAAELVSARLDLPGTPLIFAAHPVPPWPREPSLWVRELEQLRVLLSQLPDGPVVVGGDFNATHDHRRYRSMQTGGYHDAALQLGAGMIATYPAHTWFGPVIAIDHVLVRGGRSLSVKSVRLPGSDHRGILVHLTFGGQG